MKKIFIVLMLLSASVSAKEITNKDGKWVESGESDNGVKGYILTEPSNEYKQKLEIKRKNAEEEANKPKPKTDIEIIMQGLAQRITALEDEIK